MNQRVKNAENEIEDGYLEQPYTQDSHPLWHFLTMGLAIKKSLSSQKKKVKHVDAIIIYIHFFIRKV